MAPATAGVDIPFLEQCIQMGLLDGLDGISVHAYRTVEPETVVSVRWQNGGGGFCTREEACEIPSKRSRFADAHGA